MKHHVAKLNEFCSWTTACAVFLFCVATAIASTAQRFETLVNFNGTNGANPQPEGLVQGTDGHLYGTTLGGGVVGDVCGVAETGGLPGCGTIFKMTPEGKLTTLHFFVGGDGAFPASELLLAPDGNLYGTAQAGGSICCGTVFRITPSGVLTTLHNFDGFDGFFPNSRLVLSDGNFYGTTALGGPMPQACENGGGCGTIFKLTPDGTPVYHAL